MHFTRLALCAAFLFAAVPASAQVKLEFVDGRVNLVAQNVPLRTILAEWARLGGAQIVNGDKVAGAPITIELRNEPERRALDILLRGVAGYMIAARQVPGSGASAFDRIMILPTSSAPRPTPAPAAAAAFAPPPPPPVVTFDPNDTDDVDDAAVAASPEGAFRAAQEQLRRRIQQAQQEIERAEQNEVPAPGRVVGQPVFPGAPGVTNQGAPPTFFPVPPPATNQRQPTTQTPFSPFMPTPGTPTPGGPLPAPGQPTREADDGNER